MTTKFVKLTQRGEDGAYIRTWVPAEAIVSLKQNSVTEEGKNEGRCTLVYGYEEEKELELIAFNETIESLPK